MQPQADNYTAVTVAAPDAATDTTAANTAGAEAAANTTAALLLVLLPTAAFTATVSGSTFRSRQFDHQKTVNPSEIFCPL